MKKVDYYNLNYIDWEGIHITRAADDGYISQSEFDGEQMVMVSDYEALLDAYSELEFILKGLEK